MRTEKERTSEVRTDETRKIITEECVLQEGLSELLLLSLVRARPPTPTPARSSVGAAKLGKEQENL